MKRFFALVLTLLVSLAASAQTTGSINPAVTVSRVGGVAPLMVFFDATGTTGGSGGSSFHDLEYLWYFGDAASGQWVRGARPGVSSKDRASGPVAAHLYEWPGTYTVTLTVSDGATRVSRQFRIDVADPNAAFAGTQTVCFSTGVLGFTGCPAGARQITTSDFALAVNTYKTQAKRLLFRRGETFQSTGTAVIDVNGPGLIGSFGATTDPLPVLQSNANANTFQMSSQRTPNIADWRIMDLELRGFNGASSNGIGMSGGINQVTLLRLNIKRQRLALIGEPLGLDYYNRTASTAGHRIWDQLAFVDNTVTEPKRSTTPSDMGYGTYISGDRMFYAGNAIDLAGGPVLDVSHTSRFPYLGKAVVANNTMMRSGPSEHLIKLHGPTWGDTSVKNTGVGQGYTRWVVISDNKFVGANNAWPVAIGPQNNSYEERIRDILVERNWFVAGPGTQQAFAIWATDVTLRNNILDLSAGSNFQAGIWTARRGPEPPPTNIRIYNNTFYSSKALSGGQFAPIFLDAQTTGVVAMNNAAYAPNATNPSMFRLACTNCLTQSNNSTPAQVKANSPFAVAAPGIPEHFTAAGYAIGAGTQATTWSDFFMVSSSRRDLGAIASTTAGGTVGGVTTGSLVGPTGTTGGTAQQCTQMQVVTVPCPQ